MSRLFFRIFVLLIVLYGSVFLYYPILHMNLGTIPLYLAFPALLLSFYYYRLSAEPVPPWNGFTVKNVAFLVVITGLMAYGLIRGNPMWLIVRDAVPLWVFWLCLNLGRYDEVFLENDRFLTIVTIGVFAMVVIGLGVPSLGWEFGALSTEAVDAGSYRWQTHTAGYQIWRMVEFWPICFAIYVLGLDRGAKWKAAGIGLAAAYLITAVMFLKRAPSARWAMVAAMVLVLLPWKQRKPRVVAMLLVGALAVGLVFFVGKQMYSELMERFETGNTSSRFYEAQWMVSQMSADEVLFGRGMGGSFRLPQGWGYGVGVHVIDGEIQRTDVHIGAFLFILKGGIVFLLTMAWLLLSILKPKPREWYLNPFNAAAYAILPVILLFTTTVESFPSVANVSAACVWGLLAGRAFRPPEMSYTYVPANKLGSADLYMPEASITDEPVEDYADARADL